MKNKILLFYTIVFFCFENAIPSYSQVTIMKTSEKAGKMPVKIEKSIVPKEITEKFIAEYPSMMNEGWYGYPNYDFHTDWHGYNPYIYEYENPEFYIVEFSNDHIQHKAVYSKEGNRMAAYKVIRTDFPESVSKAIRKGPYSTWTVTKEKEEIFKNTDMHKLKVYKVEVQKGSKKHCLFYSLNGDLLIDKTIK